MARFSRLDVLNEIVRIGVIPVFYNPDLEVAKQIITACVEGGARVVEFTNRGDNAYRVFSDLVSHFSRTAPNTILGAGSILDPVTGGLYISSGANFIVGSVLNPELARICNRRKVAYCPGCGSASEISQAEELGVEIVKIFPGDSVGGPNFVKSILGPTPWTRIMPTGGVEATQESITAWFKAGVAAVGIGSNLIKKEWVQAGNYEAISHLTAQVIEWVRAARGLSVFTGVEYVGMNAEKSRAGSDVADWYRAVFGFRLAEGSSNIYSGGESKCHVAITVSNFEIAVEALRARGVELDEPVIHPDTKSVYLKQTDPAGNRVHLIWRRSL